MDAKRLQEVGLTKTESVVYWALLQLGSSLAGKISRKSGVHRRSVYDAMDRLIEKGLVSETFVKGEKNYHAINPRRLLELLKRVNLLQKN